MFIFAWCLLAVLCFLGFLRYFFKLRDDKISLLEQRVDDLQELLKSYEERISNLEYFSED